MKSATDIMSCSVGFIFIFIFMFLETAWTHNACSITQQVLVLRDDREGGYLSAKVHLQEHATEFVD